MKNIKLYEEFTYTREEEYAYKNKVKNVVSEITSEKIPGILHDKEILFDINVYFDNDIKSREYTYGGVTLKSKERDKEISIRIYQKEDVMHYSIYKPYGVKFSDDGLFKIGEVFRKCKEYFKASDNIIDKLNMVIKKPLMDDEYCRVDGKLK